MDVCFVSFLFSIESTYSVTLLNIIIYLGKGVFMQVLNGVVRLTSFLFWLSFIPLYYVGRAFFPFFFFIRARCVIHEPTRSRFLFFKTTNDGHLAYMRCVEFSNDSLHVFLAFCTQHQLKIYRKPFQFAIFVSYRFVFRGAIVLFALAFHFHFSRLLRADVISSKYSSFENFAKIHCNPFVWFVDNKQ